MLNAIEVFAGTLLEEVMTILETEDFDPIKVEVGANETPVREMTPLEKALHTVLHRLGEDGGKKKMLLESFLWDGVIYPNLGITEGEVEPSLGLRTGFVIVEKPPRLVG